MVTLQSIQMFEQNYHNEILFDTISYLLYVSLFNILNFILYYLMLYFQYNPFNHLNNHYFSFYPFSPAILISIAFKTMFHYVLLQHFIKAFFSIFLFPFLLLWRCDVLSSIVKSIVHDCSFLSFPLILVTLFVHTWSNVKRHFNFEYFILKKGKITLLLNNSYKEH